MAAKPGAGDLCLPLSGQFGYQQVVIPQSEEAELGRGSYGSVVRAKLDDLPCAAKILHQNFFNSNDPNARDFATRFEQECQILRELKHPCIVQFLGVAQDPSSGRLILLMEMMKESLTGFLEQSTVHLPYHVQVNISHDIALAVAHLHRNRIIHRDLSSNNVLLNAACQAKVTDFGMSKLANLNPSMTRSRVTQCPGTLAYMPPEAIRARPRYSEKLDAFSLGVLMIQIITRKFPSPTDAEITREDPTSPTGEIIVPVSEVERRRDDMGGIPAGHTLLPVIHSCLKDRYQQRPDAAELCQSLAALKTTPAYEESATATPSLSATLSPPRPGAHVVRQSTTQPPSTPQSTSGEKQLPTVKTTTAQKESATATSTPAQANVRRANQGQGGTTVISTPAQPKAVDQITAQLQSLPANVAGVPLVERTELHEAAERGDVQGVRRLLTTSININSRTELGETALILASWKGHLAVVRLLIEAHALLDLQDNDGWTALHWAALKGHVAIVDLLVQNKADINICDEKGDVPLGIAAEKGQAQTVQRLLELGANVNHKNKDGRTPLFWASWNGHTSVVRLLIENKAGVNICKEGGYSPVYAASQNGHTDVVDLLVSAGADIHLADKDGGVPLGIAAQQGHTQTVQRLLELGANVNHQNKRGGTPLLYAGWNGHPDTVELLLRAGARDIPNKFGDTALSKARANNHREVMRLLQRYQK